MRRSLYPRYYTPVSPMSAGYSSSMSRSMASSSAAHGYRPSYCVAPAKYFGAPEVTVSHKAHRPVRSVGSYSSRHYDTGYPYRNFGSRLSTRYSRLYARPELYDEYYGTSYLPGYGRDSWSAYRMTDAAIDDGEDIAYMSKRRDYETLRGIDHIMLPSMQRAKNRLRHMATLARHGDLYKQRNFTPPPFQPMRASSVPPVMIGDTTSNSVYTPRTYAVQVAGSIQGNADWPAPRVIRNVMPSKELTLIAAKINASKAQAALAVPPSVYVRASSVPPQSISTKPVKKASASQRFSSRGSSLKRIAPAKSMDSVYYTVTPPKVKIVHESVPSGRDLLTAKERLLSREVIDLESPSGTMSLKLRLADAQGLLDKHGAMLGKYSKGAGDKDSMEVESEVRRIKNSQLMRAKSVV